MRITHLPDVEQRARRVAVGTFDGVHLGHRAVIAGSDTVLTFDPHPSSVVQQGPGPRLLTDLRRKAQLIASLGVEELVVIPFDREFAARSAQQFIDDVLVGALGATHVSRRRELPLRPQGAGRRRAAGRRRRFETRIVQLLEVDGEVVSSSHIRGLVLGGAVEYAGHLLGDPFTLARRGRARRQARSRAGYPTANLVPDAAYVTPGHGVYAAVARVEGGRPLRPR